MKPFFIITRAKFMYLVIAANAQAATEKHNDSNIDQADYSIPAERCECGTHYMKPNLPEWFDYRMTPGLNLCSNIKTVYEPDEYNQLGIQSITAGKNHSALFEHKKQFV